MLVALDEQIIGHTHGVTGFANADGFKQAGVLELVEGQVGVELVGHLKKKRNIYFLRSIETFTLLTKHAYEKRQRWHTLEAISKIHTCSALGLTQRMKCGTVALSEVIRESRSALNLAARVSLDPFLLLRPPSAETNIKQTKSINQQRTNTSK